MTDTRPNHRRFLLVRHQDVTGVSGTGTVAEGVLFSNGVVALQWTSEFPTSVVFHDRGMESVTAVHLHSGATSVHWLDDETEPDVGALVYDAVIRALAKEGETPAPKRRPKAVAPETPAVPAAGPEPGPTPEPAPPRPPARIGGVVAAATAARAEPPAPAPSAAASSAETIPDPNVSEIVFDPAGLDGGPGPDPDDDPRRDDQVRAAEELAGRPLIPPSMPLPDDDGEYHCREDGEVISRIQAVKTFSRFREFLCQADFVVWDQ